MGLRTVLLFLSLCIFLNSVESQNSNWTHHKVLDDNNIFELYWIVPEDNTGDSVIIFKVVAKVLGCWGLGWSPDGGLPGSDVVVGWIKDGKVYFQDRYANGSAFLINDEQQDYNLIDAYENDTHTVFEFSRKLDTCDKYDRVIDDCTARTVYGYDDEDPEDSFAVEPFIPKVTIGTKSLLLLQPSIKEDLDFNSPSLLQWDIVAPEVNISSREAMLWCKIVKSPDVSEKHHIVHVRPMVQEEHKNYVFHMSLYECMGGTEAEFESLVDNRGHECYHPEMPEEMLRCQGFTVGWGMGGEDIMLPPEAGMPLEKNTYFLYEVNYANPERQNGIIVTSGLKIFYTPNVRENDAGYYLTGTSIVPQNFIPPRQEKYVVSAHSTPECVQLDLPESGGKIISVGPHVRMLGQSMTIRHFRNGTELPYLVRDETLDPKYQEYRYKKKPVTLLKNDQITVECTYKTSNKSTVTIAGMRTTDEICMAVIMMYPNVRKHISLSAPSFTNINKVLKTNAKNEYELAVALMTLDWTSVDIAEVQNVMRNSDHETQCYAGPFLPNQTTTLVSYPKDFTPYQPAPPCTT